MGHSGSKNRTHPGETQNYGSSPALVDERERYGYDYDYDQTTDYDSGVRFYQEYKILHVSKFPSSGTKESPMEKLTKLASMETTRYQREDPALTSYVFSCFSGSFVVGAWSLSSGSKVEISIK